MVCPSRVGRARTAGRRSTFWSRSGRLEQRTTMPRASRNSYLTRAMERCLRQMRAEEEDLVKDPGERCSWVGLTRYHPGTVKRLLQLVLISGEFSDRPGACDRFHINEDGEGVLDDPTYVPRLVRALAV